MKIDALRRFGLPDQILKRWSQDGIRFLLPVQSESVSRHGLLDGRSLIISGPGTSGKTFCGELASAAKAANRQKAIFLAPLKAIAEEKYRVFHRRYAPLGMRICLATGDHSASDAAILKGEFDIAIMIFEKFNCLTATDVSLVKNTSCFVLDEFQIISDAKRGPELELITQKLNAFNPRAQAIILMGGGSSPERIGQWLNIPVLEESRRPIDLRLGVLHRGTFHFRGYNDLCEGDEHWIQKLESEPDGPLSSQNLEAIKYLAAQGEQILIFSRSRKSAVDLASHLATALDLPPAKNSLAAILDAPPSIQNDTLEKCLGHGVAFHHAELDEHQRYLVEEGFRGGEIKIVSSTSTLAWGVNLPAKNVFIETLKYTGQRSSNSRETAVPLSGIDFHQAAGRAGRLGSRQTFGRAIMTAQTPFEHEVLWEKYIYSQCENPEPGLGISHLPEFALRLIVCGAASKPDLLESLMSRSYAALCGDLREDLRGRIGDVIVNLESNGLIALKNWGQMTPTPFGLSVAASAISVHSGLDIRESFLAGKIRDPWECLLIAVSLREWAENSSGYYVPPLQLNSLISRAYELLGDNYISSSTLWNERIGGQVNGDIRNALLAFFFAHDWISGRPTRQMEEAYNKGAGALKKDAMALYWIARAIGRIAQGLTGTTQTPSEPIDGLSGLMERLRLGVSEAMLPLARALDIDREFIFRLYNAGITSCEHLYDIDISFLAGLVPAPVVTRINVWKKSFVSNDVPIQPIAPKSGKPAISFTGRSRKQRCEIEITGKSIFLQAKLYVYFQKLWRAYNSDNSWVHKDSLERGINQPKYISKLRTILKNEGTVIDIESDGRSSYRLTADKKTI